MSRADAISIPQVAPTVPSAMWRMLASRNVSNKLPKGLDAVWDAAVGRVVPLVPRQRKLLRDAADVLALELASLKSAIELENRQQVITAMTQDSREASAAFLDKRAPVFARR